MKKLIVFVLAGIIAIILPIRIWYINKDVTLPEIIDYGMHETVSIEDNYFMDESERCDGYAIKVNNANILTYEEFLSKYKYLNSTDTSLIPMESPLFPDLVYDVEVTIVNNNQDDQDKGMVFENYQIYATDFYLQLVPELFTIANPTQKNGVGGFRLQPGSKMTFHLPYGIPTRSNYAYLTETAVKERELFLVLSFFPVQKRILISNGNNVDS